MKSRIRVKFFIIVILLQLSSNLFGQSNLDQINALLRPLVENDLFHGRVLVAEKGNIIYNKGFGYANMEWGTENELDTKYRIASISKQFTSLIIMQLVEEGKIELAGKISDYLPEYRKDTGTKVTVHHLLTHTSGIPNGGHITRGFWSRSEHTIIHYSKKDFLIKFCSGDLDFEPGSKYSYSSIGYIILGAIIEEVCKKSFSQVFEERIVNKLNLENTCCDDNISIVKNRSAGYRRNDFGWNNSIYHFMPILDGAGTILTTADDLYKYDQALYTDKLLSNKYMQLLINPPEKLGNLKFNETNYYAYGWEISNLKDNSNQKSINVISHGGSIRGGSGYFCRQPDKNNTVIILSNTEIGNRILSYLGNDIIRILNNMKPTYENRIPIKQAIGAEIIKSGIDTALKKYNMLTSQQSSFYQSDAGQLNSLGYNLINRGMLPEAIDIFILNTKAFPDNANVFDSLGEAFMLNKQYDLAVKNYKKSLELNSQNNNAVEILKKIEQIQNKNEE